MLEVVSLLVLLCGGGERSLECVSRKSNLKSIKLIHVPKPQSPSSWYNIIFSFSFYILSETIPPFILEWEKHKNLRSYCKKYSFYKLLTPTENSLLDSVPAVIRQIQKTKALFNLNNKN